MRKVQTDIPEELEDNPLLGFLSAHNFAPQWDRIKPEHVKPAMDFLLEDMKNKIRAVRDNPEKPTYKNTMGPLDDADILFHQALNTFSSILPEDKESAGQFTALSEQYWTTYAAVWTRFFANRVLYQRVKAIGQSGAFRFLPKPKKLLHESYMHEFEKGGAYLSKAKRREMKKNNTQLARAETSLAAAFKKTKNKALLFIDDFADLDGLPEGEITAAEERAKKHGRIGQWALTVQDPSFGLVMQSARNRKLREKLWLLSNSFAHQKGLDLTTRVRNIVRLRQYSAKTTGYNNFAEQVVCHNMAEQVETVDKFLKKLSTKYSEAQNHFLNTLQNFTRNTLEIPYLKPWDVAYASNEYLKHKLGFDETALSDYFSLEPTLQAQFDHFEKLLGLRFEEDNSYPVYHQDMRSFNVYDKKSSDLRGILYLDLFDRPNKGSSIAYVTPIASSGKIEASEQPASALLMCRFNKGANTKPSLLSFYDVLTLAHEMGHAVHALMGTGHPRSLSGMSVEGDYLEFPSSLMENWFYEPEVLRNFARHYKTGKPIPEQWLENVKNLRSLTPDFRMFYRLRLSKLDIAFAKANPKSITDLKKFEQRHAPEHDFMARYEKTRESLAKSYDYIFGGGYEACFYSYVWGWALEASVFKQFRKKGLYNKDLRTRLRKSLAAGGSDYGSSLYWNITNHAIKTDDLLERDGVNYWIKQGEKECKNALGQEPA